MVQENPSGRQKLERQAKTLAKTADSLDHSLDAVEQSVGAVEQSAHELMDNADRRTELAADRTVLAAERTYAAWVRTGLASLASGLGARTLLNDRIPDWLASLTGTVLVLFSTLCFAAAVWRELSVSAAPPKPDTPRLPNALLIVVNGFLMVVALAVLLNMWLGR